MTLHERLTYENQILIRDGLDQFRIYQSTGGTAYYLWGEHITSAGKTYTLYSPFPSGFPESRPPVYITKPNPLPAFGYGATVNSFGVSHHMHTLTNGSTGEVQLCHWRDNRWHSGITMNKVMLKAILWLEAYEQHILSGEPINNYVQTMAE